MELRKELRDISISRLKEYVSIIEDATPRESGFGGDGWELELSELPPVQLGHMQAKRVLFILRGGEDAVHRVWNALQYKLLRGGA